MSAFADCEVFSRRLTIARARTKCVKVVDMKPFARFASAQCLRKTPITAAGLTSQTPWCDRVR